MPDSVAASAGPIAFDVTKVWSHKAFPLIEVGELVLDRNPDNYFADVEQAAFSPGNVPPGMGVSPDKMLQGRLFAYHDAHLYRVGTNYQQLPVNRSRSPVHAYQRDGAMRFDGNAGSAPNYEPNRYADAPKEAPQYREAPLALSGNADRYDHRAGNDDYTQAGDLFRLMNAAQQALLFDNIAGSLRHAPVEIQHVQVEHFTRADPRYGAGVAAALGLPAASARAAD
jgi:catalase